MTSTTSNIWKRFLFNDQHTLYNKDIIEYHIQFNDDSKDEEVELNQFEDDNNNNINIENIIIEHLNSTFIYIFLCIILFKKYII